MARRKLAWLTDVAIGACPGDDIQFMDADGSWCVDVDDDGIAYTYWHVRGTDWLSPEELP